MFCRLSIIFSISELHLSPHIFLQICRLATLLVAGDSQRKSRGMEGGGAGLFNWGNCRHSSFIRSLFVIYFVHNLVDYNGTTRPICCCCVTYVLTQYTPCEYIHTYVHVHMLSIQLFMQLHCKDVGIRKCIIVNSIKRTEIKKIKYDQYFKRMEKAICKRPL